MSWAEIKKAINSAIGTDKFRPLDEILNSKNKLCRDLILTSSTWVVPETCYYYITCVGQGGMGYGSNSGVAGGGGAVAISKLWFKKGDEYDLTVSSDIASFSSFLSATAGANGGGTVGTGAGVGGIALGGNILNANGRDSINIHGGDAGLISGNSEGGVGGRGAGTNAANTSGSGGKGFFPTFIHARLGLSGASGSAGAGGVGGTTGGGGGGGAGGAGGVGSAGGGNGANGGAGGNAPGGGGGGGGYGGGGGNGGYAGYGGAGVIIIEYMI